MLANSVVAVKSTISLDSCRSPWPCAILLLDDAGSIHHGSNILPGSVKAGGFENGNVHAAHEEIETVAVFDDVGVMDSDVALVRERVVFCFGEDGGSVLLIWHCHKGGSLCAWRQDAQ